MIVLTLIRINFDAAYLTYLAMHSLKQLLLIRRAYSVNLMVTFTTEVYAGRVVWRLSELL